MSYGRRTHDRRRRVLYSAHQADQHSGTAASRREASRLREARRPHSAYGARVHRRLRARWFSLVPVRRRTMFTVTSVLAMMALGLVACHFAAVGWPPLAYRPEIARPLRLDRPDSFGRWFTLAMLTGCCGTSFLIYQLRRYRNDDFKGRYRLWRVVLVVMVLASFNALVSIVDWSGALLDAAVGKRVALTGSDWIQLVVTLGGIVLALRLIAEVRRCRLAMGMMLLTCGLLAIPQAARWNVLHVDTIARWVLVTSAPLLAYTALLIALAVYLRMLYREVRQIEDHDSLRQRLQQLRVRVFRRSGPDEDQPEIDEPYESSDRKWRWRQSNKRAKKVQQDVEEEFDEQTEEPFEDEAEDELDVENAAPAPRGKRRWFGLRRGKPVADDDGGDDDASDEAGEAMDGPSPSKRRRFSMRLKPPTAPDQQESQPADEPEASPAESGAAASRGLGGWFRRKQRSDSTVGDSAADESNTPDGGRSDRPTDSDTIHSDDIDWNSLSKSERRRLRKQLKRQNRAA